jgi:hypothetical protein
MNDLPDPFADRFSDTFGDPFADPAIDPFTDYDAAYVMGALDPQDRRAYEAHLSTCAKCTAAVAELAGLPGLLAQVPTEQMLAPRGDPEPVPDTMLPRLAAALHRERRRRRRWTSVVSVAAAACLVTGVVLATGALSGSDADSPPSAQSGPVRPGPAGALTMTASKPVPVTATVQLNQVAWGTRVNLTCTYEGATAAEGQRAAKTYRLVVVPRQGGPVQQVAQWTALAGLTETPSGSTDLKPSEISDIRLLNSQGDTLLHVSPKV